MTKTTNMLTKNLRGMNQNNQGKIYKGDQMIYCNLIRSSEVLIGALHM